MNCCSLFYKMGPDKHLLKIILNNLLINNKKYFIHKDIQTVSSNNSELFISGRNRNLSKAFMLIQHLCIYLFSLLGTAVFSHCFKESWSYYHYHSSLTVGVWVFSGTDSDFFFFYSWPLWPFIRFFFPHTPCFSAKCFGSLITLSLPFPCSPHPSVAAAADHTYLHGYIHRHPHCSSELKSFHSQFSCFKLYMKLHLILLKILHWLVTVLQ